MMRSATLQRLALTRAVDEHVTHRQRGHGEKVAVVGPFGVRLVDELEVRLVDERRRLDRARAVLAVELPPREPAQLLVDDRQLLIEHQSTPPLHHVERRPNDGAVLA